MDENLKTGMGTEAASHSSQDAVHSVEGENVDESISQLKEDVSNAFEETSDVQKPYNKSAWQLDEVLALGTECLNQITLEGRAEDLEQTKSILVEYMYLVCEHRNQLDVNLDLQRGVGDFAARFLYVLFRLKHYEECISWFERATGRDDALRESLEASGSVQFNVAASFLKTAVASPTAPQRPRYIERGWTGLMKSCQLQGVDCGITDIKVRLHSENGVFAALWGLILVPEEMYEKLLGTPHMHFTREEAIYLLDEVLSNVLGMTDKNFLVEAQALLRMGITFAENMEDEEVRDRYVERFQTELGKFYDSSHPNEKGREVDQVCNLSEVLALGTECLNQITLEGRAEDLEQTKPILLECMNLVCEHRNQLDVKLDLQRGVGDFAERFLYVLFRLKHYEECISWFKRGTSRVDALKKSLEASGSVQFNVAVSFLMSVHIKPEQRKRDDLIERGTWHLQRSCQLQVANFESLSVKMGGVVTLYKASVIPVVRLGNLQLVPGEMYEKLLGTPHRHFTREEAIDLLDEVPSNVLCMTEKNFPVEAQAILRMGLTFAENMEDKEVGDRYVERFQTELGKFYDSSHPNEKFREVDQDEDESSEAFQSKFVGSTDNNLERKVGTEVASTSGNVGMQQPCNVQVCNLSEVLALGTECLNQITLEGRAEDLEQTKPILVECMYLVCEHRNQLDVNLDLQRGVGDFAERFLYVLFRLKHYEECISWFERGTGRDDALKESLEASGSVQFNVAVSFLMNVHIKLEPRKINDLVERGLRHLERSCELQVPDLDSLSCRMRNVATLNMASGMPVVGLGNLQLVPGEMFEKLLGTPHSHLSQQQLKQLLEDVLEMSRDQKGLGGYVEAEAVLKMGVAFASRIHDEGMSNWFRDCVLNELRKLYSHTRQHGKAAELTEMLTARQGSSDFESSQMSQALRAENWSLAGDHRRAIEIISSACSAVDALGVFLPNQKLKARLKFAHAIILNRAGRVDEAIMQMEEAKSLCLRFDGEGVRDVDGVWYNGDDVLVNIGLCLLLQVYRESGNLESAQSLIDVIDPIMTREECNKDFRTNWLREKGLIYHQTHDQSKAGKCWLDSEPQNDDSGDSDDPGDDSGDDPDNDIASLGNFLLKVRKLKKKYSRTWYPQYNTEHLRDPESHLKTLFDLAWCNWDDFGSAYEAAIAAELVVKDRLGGKVWWLLKVYMLKGSIFFAHGKHGDGVDEYEKAMVILQEMNQDNTVRSLLSECYAMQVRAKLGGYALADGRDLLKTSAPVLRKENLGVYYFLEAMALRLEGKFEEATTFGEMAFKELIKTQQFKPSHIPTVEHAWIKIFEKSTLLDVLHFNEGTSLTMDKYRDAFIWAERSRTRFYMRCVDDQPSAAYSTCELFDNHYEHAEELLGDAVLMCGPETAIISYSYCNLAHKLICYLVFEDVECRAIRVHCEQLHIPTELKKLGESKSLIHLVNDALLAIKPKKNKKSTEKGKELLENEKSTEKANEPLSTLYSILIKPILANPKYVEPVAEQLRGRCKNLVISPEGFLFRVPFCALFEKQGEGRGEFLIQQKSVCVIPSVRTLHLCFQRQAEFEKRWEDLAPPFVAGDPKPMGAGLLDLPGAAAEARKVANILDGTQLFSGERMTKAAVLQGLGRSQLVLLSTHSIKNESQYPQGALVLRGKLNDASCSSIQSPMEETLTPADIAAIPAEIPAGLVVLSACESGLGNVTQAEGVLGLGRAILQKGAASTVLTLWKVDDSATTDLITGMFEELRKGLTVPESLQASMVHMIDDGRRIYEWAPLIAVGSPKVRLPRYSSESPKFKFISTITPDPIGIF